MMDKDAQEESVEIQSFDIIIDCSRMSFVDDVGIKALNIVCTPLKHSMLFYFYLKVII